MDKLGRIFIKNSSGDVNFGSYDLDVGIYIDSGRIWFNKEYKAEFKVDDEKNRLTIIITERKCQCLKEKAS